MRKDALVSKRVKAIIASAMAMTLAVPSAIMLNGATTVQAEVKVPSPIAVYDFENADEEGVQLVDNAVKPAIGADANGRTGSVLNLNNTIATPAVIEVVTSQAVDENGNPKFDENGKPVIEKKENVIKEAEYIYSEATVPNPFKGMTELDEDPVFPNGDGKENPYWEKGVTISYWQKATDTDSSLISFTNTNANKVQKDDAVKYTLMQRYLANPDDPAFAVGTPEVMNYKSGLVYTDSAGNKARVKSSLPAGEYTILVGCGQFVRFNPNYQGEGYYLVPTINQKTGKVSQFTLEAIGTPFSMEEYSDPLLATSKLRYGTTYGGLQFNSSGSWAFNASGESSETYQGGVSIGLSDLGHRDCAVSFGFVTTTDENGKEVRKYQEAALINKPAEWHYVTRVIKNDSISTYIDGELKDVELYTNGTEAGTVFTNKEFNVGWGYYTSTTDSLDRITVPAYATHPSMNDNSITIAPNGTYQMTENEVGYNGNTNGMTIMEMLIHEGTTLSFGGQAPSIDELMLDSNKKPCYVVPTQSGTAIDNVAFFKEPLTGDQVAALYEQAKKGDIVKTDKPEESPAPSEDVAKTEAPKPSESVKPTESAKPSESVKPAESAKPSESVKPVESAKPSTGEAVILGDVDGNKSIELADALETLKAALKIAPLTGDKAKAADVDENGAVELADAKQILEVALKIKIDFVKAEK